MSNRQLCCRRALLKVPLDTRPGGGLCNPARLRDASDVVRLGWNVSLTISLIGTSSAALTTVSIHSAVRALLSPLTAAVRC